MADAAVSDGQGKTARSTVDDTTPGRAGLVAVTSAAKGEVRLVDRDRLSLVRTVAPEKGAPPAAITMFFVAMVRFDPLARATSTVQGDVILAVPSRHSTPSAV